MSLARSVSSPLTRIAPSTGRTAPPVAWTAPETTDRPVTDLSGPWRFRLAPTAAEDAQASPDADTSGWDVLDLPQHWVLADGPERPYGAPVYTNVQFPFPVEPPHVPDANPTGDHRRALALSGAEWEGIAAAERVLLRVGGVESLARVWVNGTEVGEVRGSRLQQDLDVTGLLRAGDNDLRVLVHQWSAMSYAEDQDQWWLPGIFRELELLSLPAGALTDVALDADYDPATGAGTLTLGVLGTADTFPVTVSVPELGLAAEITAPVPAGGAAALLTETVGVPSGSAVLTAPSVEPWSAENPRRYEVTVAASGETRTLRAGFRRIETATHDGVPALLANGRPLQFRGVNRHETHPDRGRVHDEDQARADMLLMKRHHINAIRTSHYPPHPRVLDLADELGFWVIDECDYETHGFEHHGWAGNPSDDPDWHDALVDRMIRTVTRDRNHPSIVLWSLGNESGTGTNLAAMAQAARDLDPSRPIHYEGDYEGAYTDVYSRMYPPLEEIDAILSTEGAIERTPVERWDHVRTKPFVLCEYAHAMGNGPGGLQEYWDQIDAGSPQHLGGFVWEWRDHGIRTTAADGSEFFAYGGDFGEVVHDSNFVMDGLVLSDSRPSPGLAELAAVVGPLRLALTEDAGAVEVLSRLHTLRSDIARLHVLLDGRDAGTLEHDLGPGDSALLVLPEAARTAALVEVVAEAREPTEWAPAGHVLARTQLVRDFAPAVLRASTGPAGADESPAPVGTPAAAATPAQPTDPVAFAPSTGRVRELLGIPIAEPRLAIWRAPTDNDRLDGFGGYATAEGHPYRTAGQGDPGAPASAATWAAAGLDRMTERVLEVRTEGCTHRVASRWAAAQASAAIDADLVWTWDDDAVRLRASYRPTAGWAGTWPRIGLHLGLPEGYDRASWLGFGPGEAYSDTRAAVRFGRFDAAVDDLGADYAVPQETGSRPGLAELALTGPGLPGLRLTTAPNPTLPAWQLHRPSFSLLRHDEFQTAAAAHPHELPAPHGLHLYVDAAQHGIGTRSCGPDVRPEHALTPRTVVLDLTFRRL